MMYFNALFLIVIALTDYNDKHTNDKKLPNKVRVFFTRLIGKVCEP